MHNMSSCSNTHTHTHTHTHAHIQTSPHIFTYTHHVHTQKHIHNMSPCSQTRTHKQTCTHTHTCTDTFTHQGIPEVWSKSTQTRRPVSQSPLCTLHSLEPCRWRNRLLRTSCSPAKVAKQVISLPHPLLAVLAQNCACI